MSTIRNVWTAVKGYFEEFKILKTVPAEFWNLNLIVNFFEMLAYFCFITIITLYLTNNLGISDSATGDIVGVFTLLISVIVFISGPIIDTIGVKKALVISMAILIPTRLFLGSTNFHRREVHLRQGQYARRIIEANKKGEYHIKILSPNREKKIFTAAHARHLPLLQ
jgi:dipeptide/tripeptide permease